MCSNPEGSAIVTGHLDGSIYVYRFGDETTGKQPSSSKIVTHPTTPYALSWGVSICASGNDKRVLFYEPTSGSIQRSFDYNSDPLVKEFETAAANPDGDCIVIGNYNRFYIYSYQTKTKSWEQSYEKRINNLYSVTATSWRPDGSRVVVGSVTGAVEMFEVSLRRCKQGQFEYNYVSPSRIIITDTESETNDTAVRLLYSNKGYSIDDVHIYRGRYMIARTFETIIVGDFDTKKISEIPWKTTNKEKFAFDYDKICLISNQGELTIVEYGRNEILGSFRTEHVSQHLISVRNNERALIRNGEKLENNRKIAYLLDLVTIRVVDIMTNGTVATINHDCRIDFLELNPRCTHLVFRDKHRQLHLYDFTTQKKTTLLTFCSYVQWVPLSDVIVAQNKNTMCIWYTLTNPDRMTKREIKGDIETIDRKNGRTEVILFDGENYIAEPLNEGLIGFGIAIEDGDLQQARMVLEGIKMTDESEGMWRELLQAADQKDDYIIAERCAAALGDVSSARYINKINKLSLKYPKDPNDKMARDHWMVLAKKDMFNNNYKSTEKILLDHGKIDDAIQMYQTLHKYDEAIRVAERNKHRDTEMMKSNYFKYLIDSGQQDKAGKLKEEEGDYIAAINLYLEGGLPVMAAKLASVNRCGDEVCERIIQSLLDSNLFEKAGNFLEDMNNSSRALDCYIRGRVYQSAVELCRKNYPDKVVSLEEEWGDYLVSQQAIDAAINHYIESGAVTKAITAAIDSRQWRKAIQMINDALPRNEAGPYYLRIAEHYRETGEYNLATTYYVKGEKPEEAIEMYNSAKRWAEAERIAEQYFKADDYRNICLDQAKKLEAQHEYKEAERLYIRINDADSAILMYKKAKSYGDMIRVVTQYKPDQIQDAHSQLAQQLELDKEYKEAEHHYIEAGDWNAACSMYTLIDQWDEAIRVAKYNGGVEASTNVAYNWARKLGGENGMKQLRKLGLIDKCIDFAIECKLYDEAFETARQSMKSKLPLIHEKYAADLEMQNKLPDAEKEYIRANKPEQAVDMYVEKKMWSDALRLATEYTPSVIPTIYIDNAKDMEMRKDYATAEGLYMKASRPDFVIDMYTSVEKYDDAIRVARDYAPQRVRELQSMKEGNAQGGTSKNHIIMAQMYEQKQDFNKAIDAYLQVTLFEANDNKDAVERIWEKAVTLSGKHERDRYQEVVVRVSNLLSSIQRFEAAGDLLKDIGRVEEALDLYISAKEWDKAQELASRELPGEVERVQKLYSEYLASSGRVDELITGGFDQQAIDLLIKNNEWTKVIQMVSQDEEQKHFYSVRYAQYLFNVREYEKTFNCLKEYGMAIDPDSLSILKLIVQKSFARTKQDESSQIVDPYQVREVLKVLTNQLRQSNIHPSIINEFDRFLLISHYYYLRDYFFSQLSSTPGFTRLYAQVSISLLRFCDLVPPDKLFYQAGDACKTAGVLNMAMAFWNRYLDIIEAMEDNSVNDIDNSDFQITDIPTPADFYPPQESYLSNDEQEDVRNWVLSTSMDTKVSQDLSLMLCPTCGQRIYEATLKCPYCNSSFGTCVVTGYPITHPAQCTRCGSGSELDNWNQYVSMTKKCPYCDEMQTPQMAYK